MSITMFDCGFGDCFRIDEYVERTLYVDFGNIGISNKKKIKQETLYENVLRNMESVENKDFLLTHFHSDHYGGLIYWNQECKKIFKNIIFSRIFIPSIWSVNIVMLLLLGELPKVHGCQITLIDFLELFCQNKWKGLKLIHRGDEIGNKGIVALWPDKSELEKKADKIVKSLEMDGDFQNIEE